MILNKDNIKQEDISLAISVRNYLRNGLVVIGNPGLGLKKTLAHLEEQLSSIVYSPTDWKMNNEDLELQIALTKAGIDGEKDLCEYLAKLLKYDDKLDGIVAFASLSYEDSSNDFEQHDYIPDTDVLLVYGRNILIIDAKNLKTKSNRIYRLEDGCILDDKDKLILEVKSSIPIWRRVFSNANIDIDSISSYVCIVNKTTTNIEEPYEEGFSNNTLIHISNLKDVLHSWIDAISDNTVYLSILTEIAKSQIREEKHTEINFDNMKKLLGV